MTPGGSPTTFGSGYNGTDGGGIYRFYQMIHDRLYSTWGGVYDTASNVVVGSYRTAGQSAAVDLAANKVFFASATSIGNDLLFETCNLSRMVQMESTAIPAAAGQVRKLVRWGKYGLAAITDRHRLVLASGTFVSDVASSALTVDGASLQTRRDNQGEYQFRLLTIPTKSVTWDPPRGLIYAAIDGSSQQYGNSVVAIDPATNAVVAATSVGSEPSWLALSDDGKKLYVAHDSTSTVARISTESMTRDLDIKLVDYSGSPVFAMDLSPQPGNSSTVAMLANVLYGSSEAFLADDGVVRPQTFRSYASSLTWASPTLIYAHNSYTSGFDLYSVLVSSTGLTQIADEPQFGGATSRIRFAGGLLYDNNGFAYNPGTHTLVGAYSTAPVAGDNQNLFVAEPTRNRGFGAGADYMSQLSLYVYDLGGFSPVDTVKFSGLANQPIMITPLGPQNVAMVTHDNQIMIVTGGSL
jgi:YVTN family beta-propeller protein